MSYAYHINTKSYNEFLRTKYFQKSISKVYLQKYIFFQLSYQNFKNSTCWTKWYLRKLVTFVILRDHWFSVAKYSSFSVSVFDYHYSRRAGWKHDQRACYYVHVHIMLLTLLHQWNYILVCTCKCIYFEYVCTFRCIHIDF